MATFNSANFINTALESFINQSYSKKYEIIVIDGGSTDETVDIIKSFEKNITVWVSEPDNGIYDAWNKGINLSNGKWLLFVGSDDFLVPDALESYSEFLSKRNMPLDYVSSKNLIVDHSNNPIRIKGWHWEWPKFLKYMTVAHPGSLHSKKLFETYGLYDTNYKIIGDYEFLLRAKGSLSSAFMDKVTVHMQEGGASDSTKAVWEAYKAVTKTGEVNKLTGYLNAVLIVTKFKVKKALRIFGINAYLKK